MLFTKTPSKQNWTFYFEVIKNKNNCNNEYDTWDHALK